MKHKSKSKKIKFKKIKNTLQQKILICPNCKRPIGQVTSKTDVLIKSGFIYTCICGNHLSIYNLDYIIDLSDLNLEEIEEE